MEETSYHIKHIKQVENLFENYMSSSSRDEKGVFFAAEYARLRNVLGARQQHRKRFVIFNLIAKGQGV
ncbi:MAG: hypothetical protein ACR5K7_01140 [Symbiopectobacterium sp.]